MRVSKKEVHTQLENGIDKPDALVESLYEFINDLITAITDRNQILVHELLTSWSSGKE